MSLNFLPELICLFPLTAAFVLGWYERKQFQSVAPFLAALVLLFCARLSDVLIQLPEGFVVGADSVHSESALRMLNNFSDVADTLGVFLLVYGFVKTLRYQREEKKRIEQLESLLPICAWCKRIRTEEGTWKTMEKYLIEEEHQQLTHGICPACRENFRRESLGEMLEE